MKTLCQLFSLAFLLLASRLQAQTYTVTDLGLTSTALKSSATAINSSGIVIGQSVNSLSNGTTRATLFSGIGTGNTDLGTLGGLQSYAKGINSIGTIVGSADFNSIGGVVISRATRFSGTGAPNIDLGSLGGNNGSATAINVNGIIIGFGEIAGSSSVGGNADTHAALFGGNGHNTDLGTLGGNSSYAYAINTDGTIVGQASMSAALSHATIFSGTGANNTDLGTLGGSSSIAYAINDSGTIVGGADTPDGDIHATLFSGTGTNNLDLGTMGEKRSVAYAVNASGIIIGAAKTTGIGVSIYRPFIYRGGSMIELSTLLPADSPIQLQDATAINDAGQIAAVGIVNGVLHALRLDPSTTPPVTYYITVKASPISKGTVTGGGSYPVGTRVTLTAKPKVGKKFVNWKEGGKIIGTKRILTIVLTKRRTVTAYFQ